jgi:glutaminyl-peptide cyclotransferase
VKTRILLLVLAAVAALAAMFWFGPPAIAPETDPANLSGPPDIATEEPGPPAPETPATTRPSQIVPDSPLPTPGAASTTQTPPARPDAQPLLYTYKVIAEYPHDPDAFTQGLVYTNGVLYEGTGLYGRSSLRKVDLESGEAYQTVLLPEEYFGEGVTVFADKVYQLTWKSRQGFIYDADDFSALDSFQYSTEGWGLTHDGEKLIMSDGSAYLYTRDPETFAEMKRVLVVDNNGPVVRLNELEYVNGEVFANVWQTDRIARIDPETGSVLGWIDLSGLLAPEDRAGPVDVLNGIAYDADNDRLFVTGKLWPKLFEIELVPVE